MESRDWVWGKFRPLKDVFPHMGVDTGTASVAFLGGGSEDPRGQAKDPHCIHHDIGAIKTPHEVGEGEDAVAPTIGYDP